MKKQKAKKPLTDEQFKLRVIELLEEISCGLSGIEEAVESIDTPPTELFTLEGGVDRIERLLRSIAKWQRDGSSGGPRPIA